MKEQHDDQSIYCRMLGHEVHFRYCREPGKNQVCRKIADCWYTRLDITGYLNDNYSEEELAGAFAPPQPKMTSLLELVEKAKNS